MDTKTAAKAAWQTQQFMERVMFPWVGFVKDFVEGQDQEHRAREAARRQRLAREKREKHHES